MEFTFNNAQQIMNIVLMYCFDFQRCPGTWRQYTVEKVIYSTMSVRNCCISARLTICPHSIYPMPSLNSVIFS